MIDSSKRNIVLAYLMFVGGFDDVAFIDNSVVFTDGENVKYASIHDVVQSQDEFVIEDSMYRGEDNCFSFSKYSITVFKLSKILEFIKTYNIKTSERLDGCITVPFESVRHLVQRLDFEKLNTN